MLGLAALAKQHRNFFNRLINEIGQDITVRGEPAAPTASLTDVTRTLGLQSTNSTSYPETVITAIVTGPTSIPLSPRSPGDVAPVGLLQMSDVVLRARVEDVLVDEDDVYGLTIFDTAHDIVIGKTVFKVVAVERSGLPPLTPYICWCGLVSEGALS